MKQIIKLAFRNLFRNSRRTFLTVLLIGMSLAALMFVDGLILGMTRTMVNAATNIWSGELQVHKAGFMEKLDSDLFLIETKPLLSTLEQSDDVLVFSERVMAAGMLSSSQNIGPALIYGIQPEKEVELTRLGRAMVDGQMLDPAKGNQILIGKEMAELLEVKLGDRLVLTLSQVETGELSQELFRLSGVFEFGIREMDEHFVLINIDRARTLLAMPDGVHEIAARFTDPGMARNTEHPLLATLSSDGVKAESWVSFNKEISSMIELSSISIWILGGVLFTLSALGVLNSMFMSIHERIYEFGVIRAIGTSSMQLFLTVLCEAFIIAIFSVVLGCIVGGTINAILAETGIYMGAMEFSGISFNDPIKTIVSMEQFFLYPFWITVITLLASAFPALSAARIVPAEALHRAL